MREALHGMAKHALKSVRGGKRAEAGWEMWYVVWIKTGQEEKLKELCRKVIGHGAYKECFVPKTETVRRIRGELTKRENVTFPGFLFFDSQNPSMLWEELKKIPDFTRMLGSDGTPQPLYPHEEAFLRQMSDGERIIRISKGYMLGDELVITDGPLKDYRGKLVHIDRHKREAKLEVAFLGDTRTVTVGLEVVKK